MIRGVGSGGGRKRLCYFIYYVSLPFMGVFFSFILVLLICFAFFSLIYPSTYRIFWGGAHITALYLKFFFFYFLVFRSSFRYLVHLLT